MKRQSIYKFVYNNSKRLYFFLFEVRQIYYFLQGIKRFEAFGRRSITEHYNY